jgi:Holliday junction resolvase RusA-like endonuclease
MNSIKLVIYGQSYSKSNSRIFSYRNGKPLLFKNQKVAKYVEDARQQLIPQLKTHRVYLGSVKLKADIYYKTKLSDLDISLVQDILQQEVDKRYNIVLFRGVYKNDRQIMELHLRKFHDKENPRVEIEVSEL